MNVIDQLKQHSVVAVLRAPDARSAIQGVDALILGGVHAIEITYSTPDAASVMRQLKERHGDNILVGAGTVTLPAQVAESAQAGAQFLVSPGSSAPVASAMLESGIPFALGAMTPTEIMEAERLGADIVKLFPSSLGGPNYLRELRGPFPHTPIMPTGGISVANARSWLDAGAVCIGAGSDLISTALLINGDFAEITRRAAAFMAAIAMQNS